MIKQKTKVWIGVVLGFTIVAGIWIYRPNTSGQWIQLRKGDVVEAVYGLGTVTASKTFNLKIGISTSIKQIYIKEGDVVKKGQPLLMIDDGVVQKAPFDGTVTAIHYKLGETVFAQTPILTLMDLNDRYLLISLEQQGALRVKKSQKAIISFETINGKKFEGTITALFPNDGQFIVHLTSPHLPAEVLPGMTADVAIEVGRKKGVLLAPAAAVHAGRVIKKNGIRSKVFPVKLGVIDGESVELISSELTEEDLVLVKIK